MSALRKAIPLGTLDASRVSRQPPVQLLQQEAPGRTVVNKHELEARIRYKILAGLLPKQQCRMTWYGPGRGAPCVVCDRPITTEEIEVECDFHGAGTMSFHLECYQLWSVTALADFGR